MHGAEAIIRTRAWEEAPACSASAPTPSSIAANTTIPPNPWIRPSRLIAHMPRAAAHETTEARHSSSPVGLAALSQ